MQVTDAARRLRYEELAGEVYEPIQRYVRRRVSPHEVDDVVAETMLVLWRRLDSVPPNARLPWAYGVARRCIGNARRGKQRHLRLVSRLQAEPAPHPDADSPLDPELHDALAELGEADRELLRLWAWEQLEPKEIGVVMGLTPNAVSIRLHRAKGRLGEILADGRKNPTASGHRQRETEERP